MSLSNNPECEKALILDNHLKEIEISTYLDSLDLADKLLIRDTYYLSCGGIESKQEKAISKILKGGERYNYKGQVQKLRLDREGYRRPKRIPT